MTLSSEELFAMTSLAKHLIQMSGCQLLLSQLYHQLILPGQLLKLCMGVRLLLSLRKLKSHNCKQVAIAVTQILGKELLSYTMSQSKEILMAFKWESVEAFEKDSYPEAPQPDKYDFQKVKAVHKLVKAEKDEDAKKCGMPHAGVPSHCTYLQRWKQWRDFHALYYHMHPDYTTQMVHDLVMGRLKLCKLLKDIETNMAKDVSKHLVKVRRSARRQSCSNN